MACTTADNQKIIGIWQNENDWFNIKKDNKYDTGSGPFTSLKDMQYLIDNQTKELNFYTDNTGKSFYMNYEFIGTDTLQLKNKKEHSIWVKFFRTKTIPTKFH